MPIYIYIYIYDYTAFKLPGLYINTEYNKIYNKFDRKRH